MTKYLISFPSRAMDLTPEEFVAAGVDSRVAIRDAKAAGVYVFAGGLNEGVPSVMVTADGTVTDETYPETRELDGGFCVLEVPTREEALQWAARIATGCHTPQELREFMYDPES
ncbi:hypothetical protein BH11ACT5_BH11ACT5_10610 [soil metagenome]